MKLTEQLKSLLEVKKFSTLNHEHNRIVQHLNSTGWQYNKDKDHFEHKDHPGHSIHLNTSLNLMRHKTSPEQTFGHTKKLDQAVSYLKKTFK